MRLISAAFPVLGASLSLGLGFFGYGFHQASIKAAPDPLLSHLIGSAPATAAEATPPSTAESQAPAMAPAVVPLAAPPSLAGKLAALKRGIGAADRPLRILQIGDSHTAGDFFSERLRSRLQALYGHGGIGWILPAPVSGQSSARYEVSLAGPWMLNMGRPGQTNATTPLGGYVNTGSAGSRLTVRPHDARQGRWRFHALVRSASAAGASVRLSGAGLQGAVVPVGGRWTAIDLITNAPLAPSYSLEVISGQAQVAGLWLENSQPGVVLDHLGRNGETLSAFRRWSDQAIAQQLAARPLDAVILAYGTNEAVDQISTATYTARLVEVIRRLQTLSPDTAIVVVTAHSFSQGGGGSCGAFMPRSLMAVVQAQMAVARIPGVQVWNWMEAMGGPCAVAQWSRQGLMAADWIHMRPAGYQRSADMFLEWIQRQVTSAP